MTFGKKSLERGRCALRVLVARRGSMVGLGALVAKVEVEQDDMAPPCPLRCYLWGRLVVDSGSCLARQVVGNSSTKLLKAGSAIQAELAICNLKATAVVVYAEAPATLLGRRPAQSIVGGVREIGSIDQ